MRCVSTDYKKLMFVVLHRRTPLRTGHQSVSGLVSGSGSTREPMMNSSVWWMDRSGTLSGPSGSSSLLYGMKETDLQGPVSFVVYHRQDRRCQTSPRSLLLDSIHAPSAPPLVPSFENFNMVSLLTTIREYLFMAPMIGSIR